MSFLEMTKIHLARQEKSRPVPGIRTLDGYFMLRIIWKSDAAIVFQDRDGHFRRYLCDSGRSEPAVIRTKFN